MVNVPFGVFFFCCFFVGLIRIHHHGVNVVANNLHTASGLGWGSFHRGKSKFGSLSSGELGQIPQDRARGAGRGAARAHVPFRT